MKTINPYYHSAGIDMPEMFINRISLLEKILNDLFSGVPHCLSIIGQRKIGKTSLIQHISRSEVIRSFGYSPDRHIFVYVDCQLHQNDFNNTEEFVSGMLKFLGESALEKGLKLIDLNKESQDSIVNKFEEVLADLFKRKINVIFIFDEFEKIIYRRIYHEGGLFGILRALASKHQNLAWITSTHQYLRDTFLNAYDNLGINRSITQKESEMYNISTSHSIDLFSKEDAKKLIVEPSMANGVLFSEDEVQLIINFGGVFPFFVHRACFNIFSNHNNKFDSIESVRRQLLRDAKPFWSDFWETISSECRKFLSKLANGRETNISDDKLEELIDAALIYCDENGKWRLFSEEFTRFVQNKSQPYEYIIKTDQLVDKERYKIIELVSVTGASQVVKAWDERFGKMRAIKFLRKEEDVERVKIEYLQKILRREADILIDLSHPNIGKVYDIILDPIGIVMEWIEGEPLSSLINNEKNRINQDMSLSSIIKIGIQLTDALIYLHNHEHQIVHRDIKPNNIILNTNKLPKIIDFGIARDITFETVSRREDGSLFYIGTREYSSPEQHSLQDTIGPPSDIFSFGLVLYELLSHRRPFKYAADLSLYPNKQLPMPDPLSPDLADELYRILSSLLVQEPENRPSAVELKAVLQKFLSVLPVDSK